MSVAALKDVIKEIESLSLKDHRKKTADRFTNAYFISKSVFVDETIKEVENNKQARIGKLSPSDKADIVQLCETYWDNDIEPFFLNDFKYKGAELFRHKDGYLAVFSGNRSNFDAVNETIIKNRGKNFSLRERVFNQFIIDLQDLLEELGLRKLAPTQGDKTGPLDYTSYFNLGHSAATTNAQIILAARLREGLEGQADKIVGDIAEPSKKQFIRNRTLAGLKADINNLLIEGGYIPNPGKEETVIIEAFSRLHQVSTDDIGKLIILTMESRQGNVRKEEEQQAAARFLRILRNAVEGRSKIQWINQEASDPVPRIITKKLMQTAAKQGFSIDDKSLLTALDTKPSKARKEQKLPKQKIRVVNVKPKVKLSGSASNVAPDATSSYLSLITLINERLPPRVRSNMGDPRLNNRSGRLSESARVTNIIPNPSGAPSIEYTYQRSPYDVFDKTIGRAPWNTPERDPSTLISMSVRQLATELGMRRFYTRRAQ